MNRLRQLEALGQAVWLDYIRRDILVDGTLESLIQDDGVSGLTSNPAIFRQAIGDSGLYDDAIRHVLSKNPNISTADLYEELAIEDIQKAADLLIPTYESTTGQDGYVSLEVSPHLARDAASSVSEARRLWQRVDRPNLLIKIPATAEGIPAIEELLSDGINVNVTLMFSIEHYEAVAQAYLRAVHQCASPERLASVASFFVSRVDSKVDEALEQLGMEEASGLRGKTAIANSKLAYQRYLELFGGEAFQEWRHQGVRPQRVLWASTSTKNPAYRDVIYIEELVGPETVNTVPPKTLDAFRDHGETRASLLEEIARARQDLNDLAGLGIDLGQVTEELQVEGVAKFAQPFDALMATLDDKRSQLSSARPVSTAAN